MMRLIDADKLKRDVLGWEDCYNGFSDTYDKARIIGEIEEQPTIDAEPIRHGKWIECESENGIHFHKCSVCKQRDMYQGSFAEWGVRGFSFYFKRQYCPVCGARMDEDASKCEELEIYPCRGCEDYDGKGGCLSNGGCANVNEVEE